MGGFQYRRLDKNDVAVLLVDHQTGLTNLVQDFSPDDFKNNVLALADAAKYFKLPTILTTSFEDGPNGPLVPELKAIFPDAPHIARPGNINAWNGPYLKGGLVPADPWGNPYVYRAPGQHGTYDILSYGSDGTEGGSGAGQDITNWQR